MKIVVTGGAGFIGSCFVLKTLPHVESLVVLDALTYAGHRENLKDVENHPHFEFVHGDITDEKVVGQLFHRVQPNAVVHFAAESHVDNSILGPKKFIDTNIYGTFTLLEQARRFWNDTGKNSNFRFLHVSTDEVFGDLGDTGKFTEKTRYEPHSPYSASKAASDHLVRAWGDTYGLPIIVTNCSNNYGPRQFPEKLIPVIIQNALAGKPLPVYGKGLNVRDWIHVEDHAEGVWLALTKGVPSETYCFGGNSERKNIDVVHAICDLLDEKRPKKAGSYRQQIEFVTDRLGHDWRYAIDDSHAQESLGFKRQYSSFEKGLSATIDWYLANEKWIQSVKGKKK